jgi:hypothetical protein
METSFSQVESMLRPSLDPLSLWNFGSGEMMNRTKVFEMYGRRREDRISEEGRLFEHMHLEEWR